MPNQRSYRQRSASVPHTRLLQSLPPVPLPLDDIRPRLQIVPYRDDPEAAEREVVRIDGATPRPSDPPEYQPMYDYLRSKQVTSAHPPAYGTSPSSSFLPMVTEAPPSLEEPYRDESFVITIDSSPPPPSYHEIYRQHEIDMDNMQRALDSESDPAEQTEDIYKWIVAMLLIVLTVSCVGTAFNWGRPY
ncbi:hypothetical protein HYALB_00007967 [Hymenoscyphus albidus]|uniref:Uncharacterized protein n=1 Tax=Hymenoscyphus albidus TaxID=595503 RepID=A0A9N9LMH0_9HELO|nr:hypothetical protein HYALB_00007967 [Hymenoscyphus albidus]